MLSNIYINNTHCINQKGEYSMKKISKAMCTVISAAMLASSFAAMPTYAAAIKSGEVSTQQNVNYEKVLSAVKSKIQVPDKMIEFDCDTSTREDGSVYYQFMWNTDENEKYSQAHMSVGADEKGVITSYYYYDSDVVKENSGVVITDMSKGAVKAEVEKQLKGMIPERFDKLKTDGKIDSNGSEYSIYYYRVENGLRVYNNYVSVSAVVSDGSVIIRSMSSEWDDKEFELPANMLEYDNASQIYADKARFCLNYGTVYKSRNKYDAFLRYSFKKNVFIDAMTGEVVDEDAHIFYGVRNTAAGDYKEAAADEGVILTPAEKDEIEKLNGLMSYDAAEKKVRAIKELSISPDMKLTSKSINKNGEDYIMHLSFANEKGDRYSYVSVNAQNGDLYSGSGYREYREDEEDIKITDSQKENAVSKMTVFVKKYVPEYYKHTLQTDAEVSGSNVSLTFERVHGTIPVGNDGITVVWNAAEDKLLYINAYKSNIDDLKSSENVIDEPEAYKTALNSAKFEKMYIKHDDKMTVVYGIADEEKASVDAVTGQIIDGRGKPVNTFEGYSDISGHWAESIINTLADYNIGNRSGQFRPDENITQVDLLRMISTAKYSYVQNDDDNLYRQFVMENIIGKDEINPNGTVTKQQAVMYFLKMMGYSNAAEIKGIFKCDFADSEAISEEYFGYAAIAKGLGIVGGDENGNFNPEKNITNAEASVIIYNYLKK